jgi:hypothetical protein
MQAPRHLHLAAVRRIICYLQGTSARGLFFLVDSPIVLLHIVMLIGLDILILDALLLVGACFLVLP